MTFTTPKEYNNLLKELKDINLKFHLSKSHEQKVALSRRSIPLLERIKAAKAKLPPGTKFKTASN